MEVRQRVREVVGEDGWALVRLTGVPDRPGVAALIFRAVADAGVSVDMILQNASVERVTDISFTLKAGKEAPVLKALLRKQDEIGAAAIDSIQDLAVVQLVGTGILTDPSYVGHMFRVLADAGVNVLAIGTSEVRISCLIDSEDKNRALKALNEAFQADPVPQA